MSSTFENKVPANPIDKNTNNPDLYTGKRDADVLKQELEKWSKWEDKEKAREIDKVVKDITAFPRSPVELEGIINSLPIDKRFIVEKMILDEQKHQIATMSQEKYKQYLQMQFPNGVPSNVWEMALSMATDTSEMYRSALKKIETTDAGKSPSEIAKHQIKEDRAVATGAAQKADNDAKILAQNIAGVPDEVQKLDKVTWLA